MYVKVGKFDCACFDARFTDRSRRALLWYNATVSEIILQLFDEAKNLTRAQFTAKYPHPWLLCETAKPAEPPARLVLVSPATAIVTGGAARKPVSSPLTHTVLRARPESFSAHPIIKTDRNPWSERILVGRAKNNDVVLASQSVSKVQGYFSKNGARFQFVASQTLNPTLMNGMVVSPSAPPVDVADGAELQFATILARFLEPNTFYTLLVGRDSYPG